MADATATTAPKGKKETTVETVTMKDGRVVEFPGKRKLSKESFVMADGATQVRLDFRNAETRLFTIPPTLLNKFAAHGAEQKLGDEIAGVEDLDDAVLAIDELIDRLYSGEWGVKREAGGMSGTSILLRALVELAGGKKTVEEIKASLKDKTAAQKQALRSNERLKPIIARLEAEKAAKGVAVDTDALLGEIGV